MFAEVAAGPDPVFGDVSTDVRTATRSRFFSIFDVLCSTATEIGLTETPRYCPDPNSSMETIWFDAEPTAGAGLIRIKIESNVAETRSFRPRVTRRFAVASRWWDGEENIPTFSAAGLSDQALYQRRKGRDPFISG